jgi:hypothetical protein
MTDSPSTDYVSFDGFECDGIFRTVTDSPSTDSVSLDGFECDGIFRTVTDLPSATITTSSGGFSIVRGIFFLRLWFVVDLRFSRLGLVWQCATGTSAQGPDAPNCHVAPDKIGPFVLRALNFLKLVRRVASQRASFLFKVMPCDALSNLSDWLKTVGDKMMRRRVRHERLLLTTRAAKL